MSERVRKRWRKQKSKMVCECLTNERKTDRNIIIAPNSFDFSPLRAGVYVPSLLLYILRMLDKKYLVPVSRVEHNSVRKPKPSCQLV